MSDLFAPILTAAGLSVPMYLLCIGCALLCGLMTAAAAAVRAHASKSFLMTLVLLPMIVATVIIMVNGSIGTGLAVMGAFSLIRFRSVPGKARDIAVIFLSMTAGLTCAAGYVALAIVFTLAVCAVMTLLTLIPLGDDRCMALHITIPESLRFAAEFDDLFRKYTRSHRLVQAKTASMGSLYRLLYRVEMKDRAQVQAFIDELRCRNGNLEISLSELLDDPETL